MKLVRLFGALFALLSIILGALNSHTFKNSLPEMASESIDVSLRYMMFHALALLILSVLSVEGKKLISLFLIAGTLLFSFSILFLSFGYPEGFGLPVAEAMSCGCAVIGYWLAVCEAGNGYSAWLNWGIVKKVIGDGG